MKITSLDSEVQKIADKVLELEEKYLNFYIKSHIGRIIDEELSRKYPGHKFDSYRKIEVEL